MVSRNPADALRPGRQTGSTQYIAGLGLACALGLAACSRTNETPAQRSQAAKALFAQATKEFHDPSATATGPERLRLQERAAQTYRQLLKKYPEQAPWAAESLRNLAGIRAAQTNLDEAVFLYSSVAEKFPHADFEILQAWKAAGDLLWDANRKPQAASFYRQITNRFGQTNQPPVVQLVVKGSRARLQE